eukprot:6540473-Prymnesium_polylepis.2
MAGRAARAERAADAAPPCDCAARERDRARGQSTRRAAGRRRPVRASRAGVRARRPLVAPRAQGAAGLPDGAHASADHHGRPAAA